MKTKTLLMTALGSGLLFAGSASAQDTGSEMPAPETLEAPEGETPAFDPASPPPPTIDTDGDGTMDAWDQRGDGKPDTWDTTGDGVPDAFDQDGDGEPDPAPEAPASEDPAPEGEAPETEASNPPSIDSNGDGTMDAWDTNGDGAADTWDIDGDGQPDSYDNDGDGQPDPT